MAKTLPPILLSPRARTSSPVNISNITQFSQLAHLIKILPCSVLAKSSEILTRTVSLIPFFRTWLQSTPNIQSEDCRQALSEWFDEIEALGVTGWVLWIQASLEAKALEEGFRKEMQGLKDKLSRANYRIQSEKYNSRDELIDKSSRTTVQNFPTLLSGHVAWSLLQSTRHSDSTTRSSNVSSNKCNV